ncbi:MAG TPA: hypothetical protein VMV64_06140 [Sulfuricella sp.]|nr:hypothetical protein [Sulfuricella sp.]
MNWPVTFSLGVATFRDMPDDTNRLLKRADDLMRAVEQQRGKNRIRH